MDISIAVRSPLAYGDSPCFLRVVLLQGGRVVKHTRLRRNGFLVNSRAPLKNGLPLAYRSSQFWYPV